MSGGTPTADGLERCLVAAGNALLRPRLDEAVLPAVIRFVLPSEHLGPAAAVELEDAVSTARYSVTQSALRDSAVGVNEVDYVLSCTLVLSVTAVRSDAIAACKKAFSDFVAEVFSNHGPIVSVQRVAEVEGRTEASHTARTLTAVVRAIVEAPEVEHVLLNGAGEPLVTEGGQVLVA
jgi:hypothetical protein